MASACDDSKPSLQFTFSKAFAITAEFFTSSAAFCNFFT